jgi:hypothetical protein
MTDNKKAAEISVPCEPVLHYDKDGNTCYPGQYSFTAEDKQIVRN